MVKLSGPLMSNDASGQLAKQLIYQNRKTGAQTRAFHAPTGAATLAQLTQRYIIGLLTAQWQSMSAGAKGIYNAQAKAMNYKNLDKLSGFNLFVREAQADLNGIHGLRALWTFNENAGATVYDHSGNANNGTLGPTYPSNCPIRVDSQVPQLGKALEFDGINDKQVASDSDSLDVSAEITMECRFYSKGKDGNQRFLLTKKDTYGIYEATNGVLAFRLYLGGVSTTRSIAAADWSANKWKHVALTYKASGGANNFKIYKDGSLYSAYTYTGTIDQTAGKMYVGIADETLLPYKGKIESVAIYGRELGAAEIKAHSELMLYGKNRQPTWVR